MGFGILIMVRVRCRVFEITFVRSLLPCSAVLSALLWCVYVCVYIYKVEPLITDTAGEFKFCPL
jgi:hypothetical protein